MQRTKKYLVVFKTDPLKPGLATRRLGVPSVTLVWCPFKPTFLKRFRPRMEVVNILGRRVPKLPIVFTEILSLVETGVHRHHISDYSSNGLAPQAAAGLTPTLPATHRPAALLSLLT